MISHIMSLSIYLIQGLYIEARAWESATPSDRSDGV